MQEFSQHYLAPLIPVVFLLVLLSQLILGVLSKIGQRAKLHNHPTGTLDIGFSRFGPTLTVLGTLRASKADAFVNRIQAVLHRRSDGLTRSLEWRALKPFTLGFQSEENLQYTPAAAFLLRMADPFKYHLMFVDDAYVLSVLPQVRALTAEWWQQRGDQPPPPAAYEAFYAQPQTQALIRELEDSLYWSAGDYELELHVHTVEPERETVFRYRFSLTAEDSARLRANSQTILYDLWGRDNIHYFAARAAYLPLEPSKDKK